MLCQLADECGFGPIVGAVVVGSVLYGTASGASASSAKRMEYSRYVQTYLLYLINSSIGGGSGLRTLRAPQKFGDYVGTGAHGLR